MDDPLLTSDQVAKRLKVSARAVLRYCRAGLLPGAQLIGGRVWLIPTSALVGFTPPKSGNPLGNPNFGPGWWTKKRLKKRKNG